MLNLTPAYPEIFLALAVLAILVVDLYLEQQQRIITYFMALFTLLGCTLLTTITGQESTTYILNRIFVRDVMSDILKLLIYVVVGGVLVYSRQYLIERHLFRGEFFVLVLFATLGMMIMVSANHFLSLYLGLELLSLCLYTLVALQRDDPIPTEAAMKYFVLGALASGLLLYGMSMVYGATGTLEITEIAQELRKQTDKSTLLILGLVFLVSGLAFKLGVVPFHMWVPDVYQGAPTAITLLIGSAPKLAAFAIIIRLLVNGLIGWAIDWQAMLIVLATLSLILGNVVAIVQTNIKRMLAYSTIAQMGFMLLGLLSGVVNNDTQASVNAYSAALFYTVVYVFTALGAFGMILLLSRSGFEADRLEDFKGLNQRHPWYAFLTMLFMLSLAGVPPTIGFFAKLSVLQAVIHAGHIWLAVVAVLSALVGAFYYLRIVKLMYFDEAKDIHPIVPALDADLLMSANGLAVLILGVLPWPLMAICVFAISKSL